jgi:hypothetical protein
MAAVIAVCGEPSQLDTAENVLRSLFLCNDSYGRLKRIARGKIQVVMSPNAVLGVLIYV